MFTSCCSGRDPPSRKKARSLDVQHRDRSFAGHRVRTVPGVPDVPGWNSCYQSDTGSLHRSRLSGRRFDCGCCRGSFHQRCWSFSRLSKQQSPPSARFWRRRRRKRMSASCSCHLLRRRWWLRRSQGSCVLG